MASGGSVEELREEATCPICLDYFKDPVMIAECGHNFCRACLARSWGEAAGTVVSCPQCRERVHQRSLKPNRQLANIVEIAKKLQEELGAERKGVGGQGRACEKHQEPLKLFCREDRDLICVVCDRSKEHKHHDVIPVEEAAQEYQDKLHGYIEILRKEREETLARKTDTEKRTQDLLEQKESERQKAMVEFRKLQEFLEKQEQLLLAQLEEVEKEMARERDKQLARLSGELSSLENLIQEMERKVHQPASELLQDVKSILKRYEEKEESGNSISFPPKVVWRTNNTRDICSFLEDDMNKFKDTLASTIQLLRSTLASQIQLQRDTLAPQIQPQRVAWAPWIQPQSVALAPQIQQQSGNFRLIQQFQNQPCFPSSWLGILPSPIQPQIPPLASQIQPQRADVTLDPDMDQSYHNWYEEW